MTQQPNMGDKARGLFDSWTKPYVPPPVIAPAPIAIPEGFAPTGTPTTTGKLNQVQPGAPRRPGGYDWLYDVQPGQQYTEGQGWKITGPVAAGGWVAQGLGLPVAYDPSRDKSQAWGPNGQGETSMRRAFRIAADMLNNGQATDLQGALNFAMAQISGDALRGGYADQLGWDPRAFRTMAFGEKYNPQINYVAGGGGTAPNPVPGGTAPALGPTTPPAGAPVTAATPGTPAAPGPGAPGTPGATGGAGDGGLVENLGLAQNPNLAVTRVMERLGLNPDRPGLYYNDVRDTLKPYMDSYLQASGDATGRKAEQSSAAMLNEMADMFRGGQGFTGIANLGRTQAGSADYQALLREGLPQDVIDAMQTNLFLRSAGRNRMGQQVAATAFARAFGGTQAQPVGRYQRESLTSPNIQPADWIRSSPWADLLNNF